MMVVHKQVYIYFMCVIYANLYPIQFLTHAICSPIQFVPLYSVCMKQYVIDTIYVQYNLYPKKFLSDTVCADSICVNTEPLQFVPDIQVCAIQFLRRGNDCRQK
jgi:hypothetical protein